MTNKQQFNELLMDLVDRAKINGNLLTKSEVNETFFDLNLSEDKVNLIYEYLQSNSIKIDGYDNIKVEQEVYDRYFLEDEKILELYNEQIKYINELSNEEESILISKINEKEAQDKIIESYLKYVIDLAKIRRGKGVLLADLIGEGNMALFIGIADYPKFKDCLDFKDFIIDKIENAMDEFISMEKSSKRINDKLTTEVNRLNDISEEMFKELDREVTLEELSKEMRKSEDEVRELMKASLNAISVDEPSLY